MFTSYSNEKDAIMESIKIVEWQLSQFPTKFEDDEKLLKAAKDPRMISALEVRMRLKSILKHQILLLEIANEINGRIDALTKTGENMNDENVQRLICQKSVLENCDEANVLLNRRMLVAYYKSRGMNILLK